MSKLARILIQLIFLLLPIGGEKYQDDQLSHLLVKLRIHLLSGEKLVHL